MTEDTYIKCIDGKWYAFAADTKDWKAYSIGSDNPSRGRDGTRWVAPLNDSGIKYVAIWSTSRSGAYQKARRNGNYCGEMKW